MNLVSNNDTHKSVELQRIGTAKGIHLFQAEKRIERLIEVVKGKILC